MLTERLAVTPGPVQSQSWLECEARINWRLDWACPSSAHFNPDFALQGLQTPSVTK